VSYDTAVTKPNKLTVLLEIIFADVFNIT